MQFQLFHFMPPATSEKLFRSCGKITGKTRLSASYSKAYIWWASFRFTPSSVKSCISIVLCSFLVSCLVSHNFELFPMASISPSCFCCCSYTTFDLKILIVQIKLLNMLNQLKQGLLFSLNSPAQPAKPFEFHQAPSPECLPGLLKLEWPQNSFEPKLQSSDIKLETISDANHAACLGKYYSNSMSYQCLYPIFWVSILSSNNFNISSFFFQKSQSIIRSHTMFRSLSALVSFFVQTLIASL